ncbi:MAG: MFS transporter [Desulfuromonadaceae bacterium]|nr:MFS transporter [Desulfuromonadaceae bacterium]
MDKSSRTALLLAVCIAHFMMPFMMSAVGVALPALGRDLSASAQQLGLVETTYALAAAVFLLSMGRLGDIHGRKRIFVYGLLVFSIFGGLISLSPSVEWLIVLRFFQGIGGAMVMATTMAMVVAAFPAEERGRALGIVVASVYAGISFGPLTGGFLVQHFGWRSLFYMMLPLGLLTYALVRRKIKEDWAEAKGEPFDFSGAFIYAIAVLLLFTGVVNVNRGLWAWGLIGLANIGLVSFLVLEARVQYPILNVTLLTQNRVFAFSNMAAMFNYAATFGITFFMSLYLQYVQGYGPQQAGAILIVSPVVQTILSPACGRLADKIPAALVATTGMLFCAVALALAATLDASSSMTLVYSLLIALGIGFALFSSPNISTIMGSVPTRYLGVASGMNASMRTFGMLSSMMVVTLVFTYVMPGVAVSAQTIDAFLHSMHISLLVFSGLCVAGIGCSLVRLKQKVQQ